MWNKVSEKEIPFGQEVLAYNEEWIRKRICIRCQCLDKNFKKIKK